MVVCGDVRELGGCSGEREGGVGEEQPAGDGGGATAGAARAPDASLEVGVRRGATMRRVYKHTHLHTYTHSYN